jgi:predicted dinucleotide-binding enzyme
MKIGILGSGSVAKTLGSGFLKHGHEAMLSSREPAKLDEWLKENPKGKKGTFAEAAKFGELIVLAAKGSEAAKVLDLAGAANLGKTVIDTSNPIADAPPTNGVLAYFTSYGDSLLERLQKQFPSAKLVKAFNSVGAGQMVNPQFKDRPTMFICGNDDGAKAQVAGVLEQFGWEAADMGKVEAARAIEPLCMLWCLPGLAKNDWAPRAFKLLR